MFYIENSLKFWFWERGYHPNALKVTPHNMSTTGKPLTKKEITLSLRSHQDKNKCRYSRHFRADNADPHCGKIQFHQSINQIQLTIFATRFYVNQAIITTTPSKSIIDQSIFFFFLVSWKKG